MYISYRSVIHTRIIEILGLVDVVVRNTVAPAIPPSKMDAEGYVLMARPVSGRIAWQNYEIRPTTMQWEISVISPSVELGFRADYENYMMKYADAIQAQFSRRPRLENSSWQPLDYVVSAMLTDERFQAPVNYPVGSDTGFYSYVFNLQVIFNWSLDSSQC